MAQHDWAGGYGGGNTYSWSSQPNYLSSGGLPFPQGELCVNGLRPIRVHDPQFEVFAGNPYCQVVRGGDSITSGGSGVFTDSGGTFEFRVWRGSGYNEWDRNSGSGGPSVWSDDGETIAGVTPGRFYWEGAPSAARSVAVTEVGATARVTWVVPLSNGGDAITGYRIQRATEPTFVVGLQNWDVSAGTLSYDDNSTTPGVDYHYRVLPKNAVTTARSTFAAGAPVTFKRLGLGKIWSGTIEEIALTAKIWDGTAEDSVTIAKVWDGAAERDAV